MKNILFATTALAALAVTGAAQAADPIKLQLGGFSKWVVAYAEQDEDFERTTGQNFTRFDVQGDNEVFFKGSTALDNGIKIGIDVQLEAGGNVDQGTDTIDESYITIDSVAGRIILGTENNGAYLLHVSAPDAAGLLEEQTVGGGTWGLVQRPAGFNMLVTTAIDTDNDAEKITYVAPSFAGFTIGASYVPDGGTQDVRSVTNNNTAVAAGGATVPTQMLGVAGTSGAVNELYGVGAAYNNTFGGVGLKASVGFVHGDVFGGDDHNEFTAGAQFSFAGFTLGGGFRRVDSDASGAGAAGARNLGIEGEAWTVGLQYAAGPFAVSLGYFNSEMTGGVVAAGTDPEDKYSHFQLTGKYSMGPGVDAIAAVGFQDYNSEAAPAAGVAADNDGVFAMTGIALAF